ncbi:MAG TPA: D-alanine--D-alanine ligase [Ignavibacteria bacterium]|nr:D-alanine--D-alanine ligase [Ignavibacteria bacterium]
MNKIFALFFSVLNIVLITGGPSSEREVSVSSSKSILKALKESGHNVTLLDPVNGAVLVSEEEIFKNAVKKESPGFKELDELRAASNRRILDCINSDLFDNTDIVVLGVHGKFGEDGKLQNLLELRGVKYTGSGVFASAIAMDKDISKVIMKQAGILTPDWFAVTGNNNSDYEELNKKINSTVGYPCVIKPNDEGSTVGLSIVQPDVEDIQLKDSIEMAFHYSDKVIIEKYIKGRELTVPVIGDEAFPVIEIRPKDGFYDYEHKYTKGMTEYFCPADIPADIEKLAKENALKAHKALGCKVYSRVDFMLDDKNDLYCLEVNTLPGMTETSLVPKSALVNGMNFNQLIEKIIQLSLN